MTGGRLTPDRLRTRSLRRWARLVAGALTLTAAAAAVPPTASADPGLGSAQARAAHLRHQIAALNLTSERAIESYDAAEAELGTLVTRHLLAERQLQDARASQQHATAVEATTVRAIYRAGGPMALYATVLQGTDPGDVLDRLHTVSTIIGGDQAATSGATAVTSAAARIEAQLAAITSRQTVIEGRVAATVTRIQDTLARQRALLAAADAQVRQLAEAQAAAIDAAAASNAQATLDAARAAARPGGPGDVGAPDAAIVTAAIAAARAQLGKPYQWGATGPRSFDCSGLTGWAYAHAGVTLPRTSAQQWSAGPHPGLGYLQPGDLLFWATNPKDPATIHHVALYIGSDRMIAAPHTGTVVQVQPVYLAGYIGAVRPTTGGSTGPISGSP